MYCQQCGKQIPDGSEFCTECGSNQKFNIGHSHQATATILKVKKPVYKKWWFWVVAVFSVLIITVAVSGGSDNDEVITTPNVATNETPASSPVSAPALSTEETAPVPVDFVKINGGEWENKIVTAAGTVSTVHDNGVQIIFLLTVKEGDGYGIYEIHAFKTLDGNDLTIDDGDTVEIEGLVCAPDDKTGLPIISTTSVIKK